jgi:hypothetical protein
MLLLLDASFCGGYPFPRIASYPARSAGHKAGGTGLDLHIAPQAVRNRLDPFGC